MGRKLGSKNKEKEVVVHDTPITESPLEDYALYKAAKDAGFPQGGSGNFMEGEDRVYVPMPQEVYSHYIADPDGWTELTEAMLRVWIQKRQ